LTRPETRFDVVFAPASGRLEAAIELAKLNPNSRNSCFRQRSVE
jgi:hypothetical protein